MDPKDVVVDDEEEEGDDLLIQGPVLGEESTQAAVKAIHYYILWVHHFFTF